MAREQRHVLSHAGIYLLARGLPGVLAFLSIPLFSRLLEPDEYGRFALAVGVMNLLNALLFQWLRFGLVRYLPAYRDNESLLKNTLLGATLALVTLVGVGLLATSLFPIDRDWRSVLLAGWIVLAAQAVFEMCCEYARAVLRPWRYMLLQVFRSGVGLGVGVLFVRLGWGWWAPLMGLAAGMLLGIAIVYPGDWKGARPRLDRPMLSKLAAYGVPVSVTVAMITVIYSSDRFLLAVMMSESAAGHYAAAVDLTVQTISMLMLIVYMPLFPLAVHAWETDGPRAAQEQMRSNGSLQLAIGVPCVVGLTVLTPGIINCFLGEDFRAAAGHLIPLAAIAALLGGLKAFHFDAAFQLAHRTRVQMWTVIAAAAGNVVLNVLMIPRWGLTGSAVASVLAYAIGLTMAIWFGRRHVTLPIPLGETARVLLAAGVMAAALLPWRQHVHPLAVALQVTAGALVYGAVLVGSNFMHLRGPLLRRLRRATGFTGRAAANDNAVPVAGMVESPSA